MSIYIAVLDDLINRLELESNNSQTHATVVKSWISCFEAILSERKSKEEPLWQQCLSELCPSITKTYLSLIQTFHQYDPQYTQEFYGHWKLVLQQMNGIIRADSFISHIDEFKIVIEHLRTSEQRFEQSAILSVLTLYIESVPVAELFRLVENDNFEIVRRLILLKNNHSLLNQHEFIYEINAKGHCIQSVKPQKVICRKLEMHLDSSEYKMWLDFNKRDKSIILLGISLAESAKKAVAISGHVKMRGNVHDHHLLEINGVWHVMIDNGDPIQEKITMKIYLSDRMEDSISKSTKNCFRFVKPSQGGPGSRGFQTGNELEPLTDDNQTPPENTQQADKHIDSVLPPNIIAEPQLQRYDSSLSLPIIPKSSHQNWENLNSSWPVLDAKKTKYRAAAERISIDPNSLVYPIAPINDTELVGERPGEVNTTYIVRQSVDPIAAKQSENDCAHVRDNYDVISMDIEYPPLGPSSRNDSAATYNICSSANFAMEADRIVGITFRREMPGYGDDKFHEAENGGPVQNDWSEPEKKEERNARSDGKTIRVLEDVMIVPPRAQIERTESPIEHLRQDGPISFTANRNEACNFYSQPTTRHEKLFIKNAPNQLRSSSPPILVESINQMSDESHGSMQNKRKRAMHSVEENAMQKKCRHSDRSIELTSEQSQLSAVVGSLPIGTSSQIQYEQFAPPTTSSLHLPVKLLLRKTLNSQNSVQASSQSTSTTSPAIGMSSHSLRTSQETTTMPTKKLQNASMSRSNGTGGILRAKYSESSTRNASLKDAALYPQNNESIHTFDQPEEPNVSQRARNISQSKTPEASTVIVPAYASQKVNTSETPPAIDPAVSQAARKSQNRTKMQEKPSVTKPVIASQKARSSLQKRSEFLGASSVFLPPSATQKARDYSQNRTTILETPPVIESIASQKYETTTEAPPQAIVPAIISQETRKTPKRTTMQEKPPVTKPVIASQKTENSMQNRSEISEAGRVVDRNIFSKKTSTRNAARHTGNIYKKVASKATKRKNQNSIKNRTTAATTGTRFSSLKRTVTRQSSQTIPSSIEAPNNDSIHIDDSGKVYDDNVCVFADNYELQRATQFYIANDGLAYMKTKSFQKLPAEKREKCERKLRTISTMMNRGLERLQSSDKKICDLDPYRPSHKECMLQGKKGKTKSRIRATKQVSVTISTQQADDSNQVSVSRRTSKLLYVVDKNASSNSMCRTPTKHQTEEKVKSMHRATIKTTPKKLPIYASSKMKAKHQPHDSSLTVQCNNTNETPKRHIPIYASDKMVPAKRFQPLNRVLPDPLSVDLSLSLMECDQPTVDINLDCTENKTKPKELPIYASSKMKAKHQPNDSSTMVHSNNTSETAKCYQRYQPSENGVLSTNNINNQANGNGVNETEKSSCTCGDYANEWIRRLTEMVSEPDQPCRGICKQRRRLVMKAIDPLHNPMATDYFQLFNGTLASMESTCNAAEEQLDEIQKPSKDYWLD